MVNEICVWLTLPNHTPHNTPQHTSTEGLALHSPYFAALFSHPFTERESRVVELHLPCVEMLEATLYHLYTGAAPEPLRHGGRESVVPDELFGLLANAKYLLLERLQEQCTDFLARMVKAGEYCGTC